MAEENLTQDTQADETQGQATPEPSAQVPAQTDSAPEVPASSEADSADEPLVTPGMNWFVLRVASNKEDSVRETLLRKIKIEGYQHLVNRILVPTEKEKTIKGGKQKIVEKKLYPGYVFVEMKLEPDGRIPQDVFFLIKETTGVGDFIGTADRPSPMSIPEIEKMQMASKPAEEQPTVKMEFEKGDHIKIREGPFENMEGTVDELLPDQGKVRVIVTIFGRSTPIELEYWLIEKVEE
ncbi:MAG: transcription termination/antitermination protein NusG [Phycisphaeraceae bacterium]